MNTAVLEAKTTEFDVDDVEYLRHGDKPLLARVFKPRGAGPFPAMVECHGGAWCMSDRTTERLRHEFMASHGIVSIALDFRSGNEAPYPASVQDINYAVRWAKANARALKTRPDLVGLSGQSSGGHLAMLVAMRPHDPRYAAIALPAGSPAQDASVHCVIMSWPVINPLSRYRHAKRAQSRRLRRNGRSRSSPATIPTGARRPTWPRAAPPSRSRRARRCSRRRRSGTRPTATLMHDYKDTESTFDGNEPQRFCAAYAKAGGSIALEYIDMERKRRLFAGPGEVRPHVRAHGRVHRAARQGLTERTAQQLDACAE